jgi:hypothetical protein
MTLFPSRFVHRFLLRAAGLLSLGALLVLTGCDASAPHTDDATPPEALAQALPSDLELNADQASSLSARFGDRDSLRAGDLWRLAAVLQDTLSAEQIDRLTAAGAEVSLLPDRRRIRRALRARLRNALSTEQRDTLRTLWTDHRRAVHRLRTDFVDGGRTQDAFFEALRAQRQSFRNDVLALLPEDKRERLLARRERIAERREERRTARREALALTSDQRESFRALIQDTRAAAQAPLVQRYDGTLSQREFRNELRTLRNEARVEAQTILSDEQWELGRIHRGLLAILIASGERPWLYRVVHGGTS